MAIAHNRDARQGESDVFSRQFFPCCSDRLIGDRSSVRACRARSLPALVFEEFLPPLAKFPRLGTVSYMFRSLDTLCASLVC